MDRKDLRASVPTTYEKLRPGNEQVNELKNGFPRLSLQMIPQVWPSARMQNEQVTFIFSEYILIGKISERKVQERS